MADTYKLASVRARDAQKLMHRMDRKGYEVIAVSRDGQSVYLFITFRRKREDHGSAG